MPGSRAGVRGRLSAVLFAPVAALALLGLALAGAVLLAVAAGPLALAVLGLGRLGPDLRGQGSPLGGQDAQYLLGALIGLACWPFIVPAALLGARRLALRTRLLSVRWCGAAIPAAYRPHPGTLGYRQRMEWLLGDPGTCRGRCVPTAASPGWCSRRPTTPSLSSGWPTWRKRGGSRSTRGRRSCAGSSATCTTARRPGSSPWA